MINGFLLPIRINLLRSCGSYIFAFTGHSILT
nr:MAG TPA: hypothetical protein [Caudoviricetes sp.]